MKSKESTCHCDESGYFHCAELRVMVSEMRDLISIILQSDALKDFAYERGDDDLSIHELCKKLLVLPDAPNEQ